MQTRWMVAALVLACGIGVSIGWTIWGPRARTAGQYEIIARRAEEDLTRSRDALERATTEASELRERNQEITAAVERAGRDLEAAVGRARTIADLIRAAIGIVEGLENATRSGDSES